MMVVAAKKTNWSLIISVCSMAIVIFGFVFKAGGAYNQQAATANDLSKFETFVEGKFTELTSENKGIRKEVSELTTQVSILAVIVKASAYVGEEKRRKGEQNAIDKNAETIEELEKTK